MTVFVVPVRDYASLEGIRKELPSLITGVGLPPYSAKDWVNDYADIDFVQGVLGAAVFIVRVHGYRSDVSTACFVSYGETYYDYDQDNEKQAVVVDVPDDNIAVMLRLAMG